MRKIPLTIETSNLTLRSLLPRDAELLRLWLKSPAILKAHSPGASFPEHFPLETFIFGPGETFSLQYAITVRDGMELIGLAGFYRIDWSLRTAEIGLFIGLPSFQGRGYGTETVRRLAKSAADDLDLDKLFAQILPDNIPARRCFEKAGFETADESTCTTLLDRDLTSRLFRGFHRERKTAS